MASKTALSLAAALALLTGPAAAATPEQNKAVVVAFMETAFNAHRIDEAFERYVGPTYIQHNPRVPDGREASRRGLTMLVTNNPLLRIEIKRTLADGDLVAVHFHQKRTPEVIGEAIVDIFRLENGRVVEHWDVVEPVVPPAEVRNPNTMF